MLTSQYMPLASSSRKYGSANTEQKEDFSSELNRFSHIISNALDTLNSGPLLRQSNDPNCSSRNSTDNKSLLQNVSEKNKFYTHLEELLEEWCDQIETFLSPNDACNDTLLHNDAEKSEDRGPTGELNYWRRRMQLVTSVTEQVNSQHCNQVIALLKEVSKSPGNNSKPRITLLLRRWKQVDVFITETTNEAKDNIKYLSSLQRFVKPFYSGSISTMVDVMPALLNSVKVR